MSRVDTPNIQEEALTCKGQELGRIQGFGQVYDGLATAKRRLSDSGFRSKEYTHLCDDRGRSVPGKDERTFVYGLPQTPRRESGRK